VDDIIETTAVVLANNNSLAATKESLELLTEKRKLLKKFVREQMVYGVDYGLIPGCGDKPTLFLPGAEKLANIFKLRDEYQLVFREIDLVNNLVMLSYKCSIVHIDSEKKVAECDAFISSQEKKFAEKTEWEQQPNGPKTSKKVPQKISDVLNSMAKICQKRAYVGGVKKATGASDFFTSDIDDDGDAIQNGLKPELKGALNFFAEGDTMANKDKLKSFGGRWDAEAKKWKFINASQPTMDKVNSLAGVKAVVLE